MENTLVGVLLIILVSSRFSSVENTVLTKYGNFQILQKHPDLRMCTGVVLRENGYVGGRVSERTGECEGLSYDWALNQTIDSGYAYAKKVSVVETFQPQLEIDVLARWQVPGVLHTGAKLNMFISIPNPGTWGRREFIELVDREDRYDPNIIRFNMRLNRLRVIIWENDRSKKNFDLPAAFHSKKLIKISFLALEDSVKILVNDKEFATYQLQIHLKFVRWIGWWKRIGDGLVPASSKTDYLFIDRLQFEEN